MRTISDFRIQISDLLFASCDPNWPRRLSTTCGFSQNPKSEIRNLKFPLLLALVLSLSACSHLHSRALTLQLVNKSNAPVTNLAFEFPGGSFGVDTVLPGATRSKWFKPLSTGPLKIDFDDQSGHHSAQLLTLSAGDSGTVVATFLGNGQVETSKSSKRTSAANP